MFRFKGLTSKCRSAAMLLRNGFAVWLGLQTVFCETIFAAPPPAAAADGGAVAASWGYLAAALAVGLSSLGAGVALAVVGSAAMGAMSEKPELAGRALIFLGLAEGIAIYGLIVAVMILGKL